MDARIALAAGARLPFPGLECHVESEIGRGSNAIVYRGWYADRHFADTRHGVLIKELFPLHPGGGIHRREDGSIACEPEGVETLEIHRQSFESGNAAHLALLRRLPDDVGANLNTYALNDTLYTVLGFNGGRSLAEALNGPAVALRPLAERMLRLLDALEGFHESGLLHLDIAPDNIMLLGKGQRERVMLIDYNSCLPVDRDSDDAQTVFSIKPGYTAPEIRGGRFHEIGPCSDLYSVAAVFFRGITGAALSTLQTLRPVPPDVSGCPCMAGLPETVVSWVGAILRRGLTSLPLRRYRAVGEMRDDLRELLDRIDGVGITHWALWEAGRNRVERMLRDNPALEFIRDPEALYPSNAVCDGAGRPLEDWVRGMLSPGGESALLLAGGGMGKTTALLRTALGHFRHYDPARPAVAYVSLYGWRADERDFIVNRILETLRFTPELRAFEDARQALRELLDRPLPGDAPALLLLLDGLNEASGDPQPLIDEIAALSRMRGVRILAATRTDEAALPLRRLTLSELEPRDVQLALSRAGLLTPESPEISALLRTPLMLSIFIQSAKAEGRQLTVGTRDQLMAAYMGALKEKEIKNHPESAEDRWQVDVALDYVLPSLAREFSRRRRALSDGELLPVVERCWRLFGARLMRLAFPQWIGRSAAIRGGAKDVDEWYGMMVHDILWKRLGLLLRDDQGRCQVCHQIIEDYLLTLDRDNRARITRRRRLKSALIAACVAAALACGGLAWERLKPEASPPPVPYDAKYADSVMDMAASAYVSAGYQYENLKALLDDARGHPENVDLALTRYRQSDMPSVSADIGVYTLMLMLEPDPETGAAGEVMPWSGKPFDAEDATLLFSLYGDRREEYAGFAEVLAYIAADADAQRYYGETYPAVVAELVEVDGQITSTLYEAVILPHLTGEYADDSPRAKNLRRTLGMVSLPQARTVDDPDALALELTGLYNRRTKLKNRIIATGARSYYEYNREE